MNEVKISIIIPIYNIEEYVEACIRSVICQSLDDCEIILVDDGSADASGRICDEYAAKHSNVFLRRTSRTAACPTQEISA